MKIVLKKQFFDNLQYGLIEPTIKNISGQSLGDSDPLEIDLEILSVEFNQTNSKINDIHIKEKTKLFELKDNSFALSIPNLYLNIESDYAGLSDPHLLADFGAYELNIDNLFLEVETTTAFDGQNLSVSVIDMNIGIDNLLIWFDGVSDMSLIINSFVKDII